MRRSAFRFIPHSNALVALLLMAHPWRWARMRRTEFALVALVGALFSGCAPIPRSYVLYHDDKVAVTHRNVRYYPWPCEGWARTDFEVYGQHYSHIRGDLNHSSGAKGCYLEIPGRNELLFATGEQREAIVHIVDEKTHKERHFPAYDSVIGSYIGGDGEWAWEKVEGLSGDLLTIYAGCSGGDGRGDHYVYRHYINLRESKYIRQEMEYYSHREQKQVHKVYEGGKMGPR